MIQPMNEHRQNACRSVVHFLYATADLLNAVLSIYLSLSPSGCVSLG